MSEQEVAGARVKRVVLENGQLVVTGTRNQEYELVVSLNHETAQKIMDAAGIDKSNPNYKPYYAQAMAAAHHNRRFNGDEEAMIKSFAEEMQKPDMTPEKLKNFERNYRNYVLEQQQKNASGSTFANRDESAPTIDKNIQETVRSGVELRKKINPTFPDIMYDNGLLTDVVLDLSDEAKESSAIGIINSTVDKYNKYGMKFDAESNQFQVKGKPVNVQKFYSTKKNQMDKFLANLEKNGGFDASDKELFEVIENGDYQKFLELKKQRGGQDKRNMFLRNALNDEILFDRFSEEVKGKENSLENITGAAKTLSEDYGSKSDIISKESERGKITSTNTVDLKAGEIDRIVFSAKPFQVASQSTYQNWKSCMNAVGLNHRYVDDSIGQGSIVAYGYNSKNPQNKISRLLIHPWINEKGETLYVVNDRIYGESNSAFQNSVSNFTESLNQGKKGVFRFNANTFPGADGLYNDNSGKNTILRNIEGSDIDFSQAKKLELSDADLSQAKSIKFPENVSLSNVVLGNDLDFSRAENLKLKGVDLSKIKSFNYPKNVSLNNVALGDNLDFSHTENLDLGFVDLSKEQAQSVKLSGNVKLNSGKIEGNIDFSQVKSLELLEMDLSKAETIKFPENVEFKYGVGYKNKLGRYVDFSNIKNLELTNVDLSRTESIKFPENVKISSNVRLGENVDFSQVKNLELTNVDLSRTESIKFPENVKISSNVTLGENVDFSNIKNLELNNIDLSKTNISKFPENIKFGYGTKLGGNLDFSDIKNLDLSGVDLSEAKSVKFPENVKFDMVTLGDNVDFSDIKNLELSHIDLSKTNISKFPENIKFGYGTKLGGNLDFSDIKNLDLSGVDLSEAKSVKFPENVKFDMVTLGDNVDFSDIKNLDLSGVDLSEAKSVKFPENVKFDMVTLGDNVDFSDIKNLELSHIDLSKTNISKFPENIKFGYGTKLGGNLDFSDIKNLDLSGVDLSEAKSVKFPENVKLGYGIKLGGNIDFSQVKNLELYDVDLSKAETIKFPEKVQIGFATKLNGDLDFSQTKNLDLSSADLSEANIVKFPESIKLGYSTEFKDNVDLSSVKNIEIPDLSYIDKFNISGNTNIKLGKEVEIRKKEDLNTLKRCDTSETKTIFFDEKVLSEVKDAGMEFPTGKILGFERNGKIVVVCDEKSRNELIKNSQIEENKVDFMSPEEFSQKEGVKFETKTAETQIKPHEPEAKTTELKETLKQQAETKSVQNEVVHQTKSKIEEPIVKTTVNENTPELKETLKGQSEAAHQTPAKSAQTQTSETKQNTAPEAKQTQKTEAVQTQSADADLRSTLKNQKASGGLENKISAVSNSIDNTLEKAGKALNDNAVGRAISEAEAWRPHNKTAAKIMDKTGAVPIAAITASGVSAYEQYKAGDTKGALETMGKGTVHAAVQGIGTQMGMNAAAKGLAKGTEKVVTKVTEHNLTKKATQKTAVKTTEKAAATTAAKAASKQVVKTAATTAAKAASKQVVKTAAKTAGKAAGKAVLKKIPLVSLAAGAYFAYERVKDGEWGKAGCELLSGAAGCVPGVGTVVSTGIDCGLAVADTKQAIDATKKQQAQQQPKTEQKSSEQIRQEQKKKAEMAKKAEELRNTKPGQSQQKSGEGQQKSAQKQQKMAKIGKPAEKNWIDYIKNAMSSR